MSRIAIAGYGTRGDIQPVIAVGDALAKRWHAVWSTANTNLVAGRVRRHQEV